ncbi:MAG: hypothetical protein AAF384_00725 [Pseudomonadota bacterium]
MDKAIIFSIICAFVAVGCAGDDPASSQSGGGGTAAPVSAAPSAAGGDEAGVLPAAVIPPEVTYEPIDTANLENQWWQQFDGG